MDDDRTIRAVKITLFAGVALSAAMLLFGIIKTLATHQPRPEGRPPELAALFTGLLQLDGLSCLYLGLLTLMCTPLIRVAALTVLWALEGEKRFAAVAATVLFLLGLSIYIGSA